MPKRPNYRGLSYEILESRRQLANLLVTNVQDSGAGSFRQAILDSNASMEPDYIAFAISGQSRTIELQSSLPDITNPVLIDATTQPGFVDRPLIELSGQRLSNREYGLVLRAGDTGVKGLVVNRFPGVGILIEGKERNRIEMSYVGTDSTGMSIDHGNGGEGIVIVDSKDNQIGSPGKGNLVSGNGKGGIVVLGRLSEKNWIVGNRIGTDIDGIKAIPNEDYGVLFVGDSGANVVGVNHEFGTGGEGNLISGNGKGGIRLDQSHQNTVSGNTIGIDATGSVSLANQEFGVLVNNAVGNRIGSNSDGNNDLKERNYISGNSTGGIRVFGSFFTHIAGNWIGTSVDGLSSVPNGQDGILVDGSSANTVIGLGMSKINPQAARNVISGNKRHGVWISGGIGSRLSNNFVGIAPDGETAIPNALDGVLVSNITDDRGAIIGTDSNGESDQFEGNTISGNGRNGVWISNADYVRVAGNILGLSADGAMEVGNKHSGIWISHGSNNTLIGTNADGLEDEVERNVISGNLFQGVAIGGTQSNNNRVAGNYIGTDKSGLHSIPNRRSGVLLNDQSYGNTLGGLTPQARNIISGNVGWGIELASNTSNNYVFGNWVGLDVSGQRILGNSSGGIQISQSDNNKLGNGTEVGANSIVGNGSVGIRIVSEVATRNSFFRNTIGNHSSIEVDLGGDGPTPNDPLDQDIGPNDLQNYPTIDFVASSSSFVQIAGDLQSTPNTDFDIDFYSEIEGNLGRRFMGSLPVRTDANGSITWTIEYSFGLSRDSKVYASARSRLGNQSEFSPPIITSLPLNIQPNKNSMREGDSGLLVSIWRPVLDDSSDLVIHLSTSEPTQITIPAQVVIAAGKPKVDFFITCVDDAIFESGRSLEVVARTLDGEAAARSINLHLFDNDSKWRNYAMPLDVDSDRSITALDVLAIVNYLNSEQNRDLFSAVVPTPPLYLDTAEDETVNALDVLAVVNYLNGFGNGEGEGVNNLQKVDENKELTKWWATAMIFSEIGTNDIYEATDTRRSKSFKR